MSDGTDGGIGVESDVERSTFVTGKGNRITTSYGDTVAWREFVRRDLSVLEERTMIALAAIMILFVLGAVAMGMTIRQFDLMHSRLDRAEERIERVEPLPYQPWMPQP